MYDDADCSTICFWFHPLSSPNKWTLLPLASGHAFGFSFNVKCRCVCVCVSYCVLKLSLHRVSDAIMKSSVVDMFTLTHLIHHQYGHIYWTVYLQLPLPDRDSDCQRSWCPDMKRMESWAMAVSGRCRYNSSPCWRRCMGVVCKAQWIVAFAYNSNWPLIALIWSGHMRQWALSNDCTRTHTIPTYIGWWQWRGRHCAIVPNNTWACG